MKRIAITTGDADGIGFEVGIKALRKVGPKRQNQFLFWSHTDAGKKIPPDIKKTFAYVKVSSLDEALNLPLAPKQLIHIHSSLSPSEWVQLSAKAALGLSIDALVTGPLSKTSPGAEKGHTGIFRELVKSPLFMYFAGPEFNVLLVTDHLPLKQAVGSLTKDRLIQALTLLDQMRSRIGGRGKPRPIGILGLNPHAGEKGLIGTEEHQILIPFIQQYSRRFNIEGPLVPDAAFLPGNWKRYFSYVALYHDQGLIPFKLIHGQSHGVQITLGLPFVRTSVDHGTAKELFGLNKANPGSMIDALQWAIKLTAQ